MLSLRFPHSPFSTPLSGSAKEVEQRLRSIFRPPEKRPPSPPGFCPVSWPCPAADWCPVRHNPRNHLFGRRLWEPLWR